MIKFFQHIRLNLLNEGKTTKYFKYAVGEILLVMIGILLALQVNNWNEIKKENRFEKKILKEILVDTEEDLKEMKNALDSLNASQESAQLILQHLGNNISYNDTLDIHFAYLLRMWSLSPNSTAFEMAKSEGLHLIKNDSIRTMIAKIHGYHYDYVGVLENRWQDYNTSIVIPTCLPLFDYYNFVKMHPIDYEALKSDMIYQGIIKSLIAMRSRYLDVLKTRYDMLFNLNKKIKEELL